LLAVALAGCHAAGPRAPTQPATKLTGDARPAGPAGLLARFRDGKREVVTIARSPSFTLAADESVHPGVGPAFEATYEGFVEVPQAGKYELDSAGATVAIDDAAVTAPRALTAGRHKLRVDVQRAPGPARLQVRWRADGFDWEPLPVRALSHDGWPEAAELWRRIDRGRALLDELNCRACHVKAGDDPQSEAFRDATRRGRGPMLTRVGARTNAGWIRAWLENPRAYRPQAKMPIVLRDDRDRRDAAAFLATLRGDGYAANGSDVVDIESREPTADDLAKGKALYEKIGCTACHGEAAAQVSLAAVGSKMTRAALFAYLANMWLPGDPDQSGRMPLLLYDKNEAVGLSAHLATFKRAGTEGQAFGGGDVARGRKLVSESGCASCHEINVEGERLRTRVVAPRFEELRGGDRGCLAKDPSGRAAKYALSDEDRRDLAMALDNADAAPSPIWEWKRLVDNRRCGACHEIDGAPGVRFAEAPPALTEAGHKLRPAWIHGVVEGRTRVRPWLSLRMPRFHQPQRVGELFAAVAGEPLEVKEAAQAPPAELATREGVRYLGRGEEGLACITCHDVGSWKSGSATPAPDISTMHDRLRPEWFRRWLLDPPRIQPGTQMPAFFAEVDRGVADKKIEALWSALSLGTKMPAPEGVTFDNHAVPFPVGKDAEALGAEPVALVRTFLPGSSTRTIAIGFPGGRSFAWDAERCRLVRAWDGGFLDMRPVWFERGGGEAGQVGATTYVAPAEASLRIGDPSRPPARVRFRGYAYERHVPVLEYEVDGAEVRERIEPQASGRFARSFDVRRAAGPVWYVTGEPAGAKTIATARGAKADGAGRFRAEAPAGKARFSVLISPAPRQAATASVARPAGQ
jgi:cbb3-type cytochrome oxidase cytochrome c subunit/cytochrome c551/c552